MSPSQHILEDRYSDGKPNATVRIAVINPETFRQVTIKRKVRIDTGFDAGVHIAQSVMSELSVIGVEPTAGAVILAGNIRATAHFCHAYLQQIGDHELPAPGIEIALIFQGSDVHGLLGLEVLNHWIVTFNGPHQFFKIVGSDS